MTEWIEAPFVDVIRMGLFVVGVSAGLGWFVHQVYLKRK